MVRLKRDVSIQTEERVLGLKLEPTDDFGIGINQWGKLDGLWSSDGGNDFDASMHKVTMNDFLVRPARWIPAKDYAVGEAEGGLWGAFTRKKYELMCEKFNLTYEDFESEATTRELPCWRMTDVPCGSWGYRGKRSWDNLGFRNNNG